MVNTSSERRGIFRSSSTNSVGIGIVRALDSVFGLSIRPASLSRVPVTVIVFLARSMSRHLRPRSSLSRSPVVTAARYSGYVSRDRATSRSRPTCWLVSTSISRLLLLGLSTPTTGLRCRSSHLTAWFNAARNTRWQPFTVEALAPDSRSSL